MAVQLRSYQVEALRKTAESFQQGYKRPCIVMGCGGGKTCLASFICDTAQRKGRDVLFLVHRKELLDQTLSTFDFCGIERRTIQVGMVKTVANHPERYPKFHTIIVDEAHLSITPTYRRIIDAYPDAYVVGLTGSPVRLDGRPLNTIYDTLILGPQTSELIAGGYLAPYRYYAPSVADLTALRRKGFDFDAEQATEILSTGEVYGDVIRHYRSIAEGKKTICYCSSIRHSKETAQQFRAAGYAAVHFDGDTPKAERTRIVRDFRDGKIQILCNVNLIGEGLDVPDCECCILLRPTCSVSLFIQQSNRALRYMPGKTAVILDHVGNALRHGLPDEPRHWTLAGGMQKRREYTETGRLSIRTCLRCYSAYDGRLRACPYCHEPAKLTEQEIRNIKEIQLQELKVRREAEAAAAVAEAESPDDCKTMAELQAYAKRKGYRPGWVWYQAKIRGWRLGKAN